MPESVTLLRKTIALDRPAAAGQRYLYVPVEVPRDPGALRLAVDVKGDARVDVGLLEPDPSKPAPAKGGPLSVADGAVTTRRPGGVRFRGWSGSDRPRVIVGAMRSTAGYLLGAPASGSWWVVLGLARVTGLAQVDLVVEWRPMGYQGQANESTGFGPVEDDGWSPLWGSGDPAAELASSRKSVRSIPGVVVGGSTPAKKYGFVAGDFHTHSWHSGDAKTPISEMIAAAEVRKLDFLAVTDHNTISHWEEIDVFQPSTSTVLIKGQEVTTYSGHFNAFLWSDLVEFRIESDADLARALSGGRPQHALASVNHPKLVGPSWRLALDEAFEAVEAWGAPWLWFNNGSLRYWDGLLRQGRRLTGIGGSDVHDLRALAAHQYGCPCTWVYMGEVPVDPVGILDAVRRGWVVVTATPDSPLVFFEASSGSGSQEGAEAGRSWKVCVGEKVCAQTPLRVHAVGIRCGEELRLVGESGRDDAIELGVQENGECTVEVVSPERYGRWVRAELWGRGLYLAGPVGSDRTALLCMTNPVFFD